MKITLSDLRDGVFERLGDRGYFRSPSEPTAAEKSTVDRAVNESVSHHIEIAEGVGSFPLNDTVDIDITEDVQEYNLDALLLDDDGDPNFRAHLFVLRIGGVDDPIPVFWGEGGDHWVRHVMKQTGLEWPETFDSSGATIDRSTNFLLGIPMYRRGNQLGFVTTPTASETDYLRIYYVPTVPQMTEANTSRNSLPGIGLQIFNTMSRADMIYTYAAIKLAGNIDSQHMGKLVATYSAELNTFTKSVASNMEVQIPIRPIIGMEVP